MRFAIIVGSHPGDPFLKECIDSLCGMECMVIVNWGFEPGKLTEALQHTTYDSFLFIPSTVTFKSVNWIPRLWLDFPERSVSLSSCPAPYGSFMGKYRRAVLERIAIPVCLTKVQAVNAERSMSDAYCAIERPFEYFTDLNDNPTFTQVHGQTRMVIENDYVRKLKQTFNMGIAEEIDRHAPARS